MVEPRLESRFAHLSNAFQQLCCVAFLTSCGVGRLHISQQSWRHTTYYLLQGLWVSLNDIISLICFHFSKLLVSVYERLGYNSFLSLPHYTHATLSPVLPQYSDDRSSEDNQRKEKMQKWKTTSERWDRTVH